MTRLRLKDELLDAQLLRVVGAAPYGGADIGECLATVDRIEGTDLTSWYEAWSSTSATVAALGDAALADGRVATARAAFLRASSYARTAGLVLMGVPIDPRLVSSNARQTDLFRRAAALLAHPPEVLAIPYEGTTLPGYFFRVDDDPRARPTVVLLGGYDGTAEELYFFNGAAALERGYNVLAFDGPGQGAALIQQGLVLRPDYEHVLTAVLDHALARPDVDPDRVALIGLSLGGHLAPRAVSGEHRFAACIAESGSYDMFESALERVPGRLASGVRAGTRVPTVLLGAMLRVLARKPTAGWALRRGQLVHGTAGPLAYFQALRPYSLDGRTQLITCPILVCHAEGDDIGASAPRIVEAVPGEKQVIGFTAAEGAGDHCESGARLLYHARTFGWLDRLLAPDT